MEINPEKINKYLYIEKTPTWVVRSFYAISILTWLLLVFGFSYAIVYDSIFRWTFGLIVIFLTVYYLASYILELFYKKFDIQKHENFVSSFWKNRKEPSVDIFLPVCGEDAAILKNTWEYVSRLKYKNFKVYVLDDSKEECEEHERVAKEFGFTYFARPNKGEMKKAGNLKYAYERTNGEFIIIFDADFAPRHDFIYELLPYMANPKVSIVQSPQYFEATKEIHRRSPLEYGAAQLQESFYRFIQVSRNRFGGVICCGSNAIYRRKALDEIGGTIQVEHSEDARTGFALRSKGWDILYIPIILALGICPNDTHAYFHQQHRWGLGSMTLGLSKEFWTSPVSWKTKYGSLAP